MRKIRIGSRGSKLALWQTDLVLEQLKKLDSEVEYEKIVIKTKGDKLLDVALSKIGDKGLFTKELENDLLAGDIDLAVHSLKDMPTLIPDGLTIGAVLVRENPRDVLLAKKGQRLADLLPGARVGTSSPRRQAQLKMVRPDLEIAELRGNIDTRIRRLDEDGLDAIILAWAGVKRLGYENLITEELDFLPAVGQGAIAIEMRSNDPDTRARINPLDDRPTRVAVEAERALLAALEGGCQIPIGALGRLHGASLELEGLVASLDGTRVFRDKLAGDPNHAAELGKRLAEKLLDRGAGEVLGEIRSGM